MSGLASSSEASRSTVARASASEPAVTVSSTRRPTRTSVTPRTSRWPRLASTARPWGSRMPGFGVTFTANRNAPPFVPAAPDDTVAPPDTAAPPDTVAPSAVTDDLVVGEVPREARARDPFEGRDIALACAGHDVGGQLRTGGRLAPRLALEPVADELLVVGRLRAPGLERD